MKVTAIRFSRTLLLVEPTAKDGYIYKTIYGYIIEEPIQDVELKRVDEYCHYLEALHLYLNGADNQFTINNGLGEPPYWIDKKGVMHTTRDTWMKRICQKAHKKLQLSYTVIPVDIDDETYARCINTWYMIVDEDFYYHIDEYIPHDNDDDLPF